MLTLRIGASRRRSSAFYGLKVFRPLLALSVVSLLQQTSDLWFADLARSTTSSSSTVICCHAWLRLGSPNHLIGFQKKNLFHKSMPISIDFSVVGTGECLKRNLDCLALSTLMAATLGLKTLSILRMKL